MFIKVRSLSYCDSCDIMAQNEFYAKLPFSLNEDEKVVDTVKPIWIGYFLRNSLHGIFGSIFIAVFLGLWAAIAGLVAALITFLVVLIIGIALSLVSAKISYGKFRVWITDQRIVSASGFIGFHTESLPLENITDVVINRGLIDRLLNLSSIMAVPMGGMVIYGRRSNISTVGFIPALHPDDATKLQKLIFDLKNARIKALKEG